MSDGRRSRLLDGITGWLSPHARGMFAALMVFAALTALQLAAAAVGMQGFISTSLVDFAIALAGPGLGRLVAERLPAESRWSFWYTALVCTGLTVISWGQTCAAEVREVATPPALRALAAVYDASRGRP